MLADLFVIVIYFLAIFCIGIYAGRKQNSLTDYALGNRSLPWWASKEERKENGPPHRRGRKGTRAAAYQAGKQRERAYPGN